MKPKQKTTLLIDAEVWKAFQEEVTRHEGPRAASAEVERLLRGMDPEIFEATLAEDLGQQEGGLPSLEEVERKRPRLRREVTSLIRDERDEREHSVRGL